MRFRIQIEAGNRTSFVDGTQIQLLESGTLFEGIPTAMDSTLSRAVRKAGLLVESEAKRRAPVGVSGILRASITTEVVKTAEHKFMGVIGTALKYAPWREFETRPHWAPVTETNELGLWIKRKLSKRVGGLLGKAYAKLERFGLNVKSKRTGDRHFLPFHLAPGLKIWAAQHDKLKIKYFHVSGKATPFLIPAFNEKIAEAIRLIHIETGQALK